MCVTDPCVLCRHTTKRLRPHIHTLSLTHLHSLSHPHTSVWIRCALLGGTSRSLPIQARTRACVPTHPHPHPTPPPSGETINSIPAGFRTELCNVDQARGVPANAHFVVAVITHYGDCRHCCSCNTGHSSGVRPPFSALTVRSALLGVRRRAVWRIGAPRKQKLHTNIRHKPTKQLL